MDRVVMDATPKIRPSACIGPMGADLGSVRLNVDLLYTSNKPLQRIARPRELKDSS
jgi:hypothetical protein